MPFNIEPTDIILIALAALLLFGPSRLPEVGRGLGKAISEFRNGLKGMSEGFREEVQSPDIRQTTGLNNSPNQAASSPVSGNFCTQCGAPNPTGVAFCNQCGNAFQKVG